MTRICVYVAGAYDGPDVCTVLRHMRWGLRVATHLLKLGYAPFAPWLDFQFGLTEEVSREEMLAYSMAWLEKADVMFVVIEGVKESLGTQAEIARAEELGIPIVWTVDELRERFPVS